MYIRYIRISKLRTELNILLWEPGDAEFSQNDFIEKFA